LFLRNIYLEIKNRTQNFINFVFFLAMGRCFMLLIIKCGADGCGKEYKAETNDRLWLCPYCDHEILNKDYPFLCAKLMEAKSAPPEETDWYDLFDVILRKARVKLIENNMRRLEEGLEKVPLGILIEFENMLQEQDATDFQQKTQKAMDALGKQIMEQEDELES